MKHQAGKFLIAGPVQLARFAIVGLALVPYGLRRQYWRGGVSSLSALKRLALAVLATMALVAVPLTSPRAATATYAILFDQTDPAPSYPPNLCGTDFADHCGLFSFETADLPDGAPVSSFAADFAFTLPDPGPPDLPAGI